MNRVSLFPKGATLDDKIQIIILAILRLSLVAAFIWAGVVEQPELMFISLLALILTFVPLLIHHRYKIRLPIEFELFIVLFIYASIFLGELGYYNRFWWWDTILHISSGLVLSFTGFLILFILYNQKKFTANPFILAVFTFSFGLAVGALWEVFEFGMDQLFGLNMQKNGLHDTMWDLIVDGVGASMLAVFGYRYIKHGGFNLLHRFISNFLQINPHLKPLKRITNIMRKKV